MLRAMPCSSTATGFPVSDTHLFFQLCHFFLFPLACLLSVQWLCPRDCRLAAPQGICTGLGALLVEKYVKSYVMGVLPATESKATQASAPAAAAAASVAPSASSQSVSGSSAST
jgi:hypothetical protein